MAEISTVEIQGLPLELHASGKGRPILFLSAGLWLASDSAFVDTLSELGRVTMPAHPGFGKTDPPHHLTSADDLAYLYLDLIEQMVATDKERRSVVIVAASLGAFIALQMAIKSCAAISALALLGPAGVKAGGREQRDYADLFAHTEPDLVKLAFAEPARFEKSLPDLPEAEVLQRVRAREALARYVWQPYMHDPRLAGRLHRIAAPTLLLQGSHDRIVAPAVARLMADRIPNTRLTTVPNAGHMPHVEQPATTLGEIRTFLDGLPKTARSSVHA